MANLLRYNNSGDTAPANTGTVTVDSSIKFEGADSLRFDDASAYSQWTVTSTIGRAYFMRTYLRLDTLPTGGSQAVILLINTGGSIAGRLIIDTLGRIRMVNSGGSFVGNLSGSLSTGVWNLIEWKVVQNATAANGTAAFKVNGTQIQTDTAFDATNVAINRWRFGRPTNGEAGLYWHDMVALNDDQTGADNTYVGGTIPPGAVTELRPSGHERKPVVPCGSLAIANTTLANNNDRWGLRFILDQSNTIYRIWFAHRMGGVNQQGNGSALTGTGAAGITGTGYGGGNGGTLRFDLFAVGTDGKPTGSALYTESSINAVDRYNAIYTELSMSSGQHMLMYAQLNTASLSAGEYIMTVQNTNGTPATHYSSVNNPSTSLSIAGPHAANTRDRDTAGAMMGLDARECVMWSIDTGTHWYWGNPVGGETVAHGITGGEARAGGDPKYYVGTGDDAIRLPFFAIQYTNGGQRETYQPYYGSADATGVTLTAQGAGRAVTLTDAGAFAHSGQSVGTITVTNINTGVSATCTPGGTGGKREAALSSSIPVAEGETITIACTGTVAIENADLFQQLAFNLGSGDNPFSTSGNGVNRLAAYALPWPYFSEIAAEPQILLPDADTTTTGWTTTPLFSKVNDSSDATVITGALS